ncbi:hypothetical protein [Micromonospora carbonacea]|uniref:hypothetical protein n=1 Tax=Micromonospora carbonacea TaxID=47853 RepID=UPI003713E452
MLTDSMPAEAVETARKRLSAAAEDLDANEVAALLLALAADHGVLASWQQVCVPLLAALRGHTAAEVATEHALSEGVRIGLDVFRREPGPSAHRRGLVADPGHRPRVPAGPLRPRHPRGTRARGRAGLDRTAAAPVDPLTTLAAATTACLQGRAPC